MSAVNEGDPQPTSDSRIPGLPWVLAIVIGGLAISWTIIGHHAPEGRWSEGLGTAAQVFLASVVAAFGVQQIVIARAALRASLEYVQRAEDSVTSTNAQNDLIRDQLTQAQTEASARAEEALEARKDAEFQRDYSRRALVSAIRERLDSQAPRLVVNVRPADTFFEWRNPSTSDANEWKIGPFSFDTQEEPGLRILVRVSLVLELTLMNDIPARVTCNNMTRDELRIDHTGQVLHERGTPVPLSWVKTYDIRSEHAQALAGGTPVWAETIRPTLDVRSLTGSTLDRFSPYWTVGVMKANGTRCELDPGQIQLYGYAEQAVREYPYFSMGPGQAELGFDPTTLGGPTP